MGAVIGIVVLLGVSWLFVKARDQFWKGANQHVLARSQHADGQQLTRERLIIRSTADPDALQDAIVRGLALPYDKSAAVHAELFQGPLTPGYVQFCSGTKIMTVFTAGMRIEPGGAGGSTLTYKVEKWTLADGIVAHIPQLKFLRRRIEDEARKIDPQLDAKTESTVE
jgi:hypothetical protein